MYRLSYYPWITQHVAPEQIAAQIGIFAGEIQKELAKLGFADRHVQVLPPVDVPAQIDQLVDGDAEIALMNPLGFVFAKQRSKAIESVAVAQRIIDGKVGTKYFAQLYARKDSAIGELKDVADRSVGYGQSFSTSNFLLPALMLHAAGVHPLCGFRRVEFLKGHEIVARAVYWGKVMLGAGHDGVIDDLARQPGFEDAKDVLQQIKRSDPIPSDPVVVRIADAAEREKVKQAVVAAGNTPAGKNALKIFWGNVQSLEATATDEYRVLSQALQTLKLGQEDLLPKVKV
jgi:phosphonate transport system substrate-binding protein